MVLVEIRPKAWHAGMPLSWNEIRHRAIAFSKEWKGETREAAERQHFGAGLCQKTLSSS